MATAVTNGISITVRSRFDEARSDMRSGRFLHIYRITITNESDAAVQLLRRHWYITDSLTEPREVEGEGVVGETPVLRPGESFTYASACDLRSSMGRMQGTYLMKRLADGMRFEVTIPEFLLAYPYMAN
ncbi:MAG: Co2+/Mg2+ efflux protein ApaG [Flavobacteriales bacterium]|nr:Co2+/Mg2+ efflux protein ApaG [Flavobacteriales bacterium]